MKNREQLSRPSGHSPDTANGLTRRAAISAAAVLATPVRAQTNPGISNKRATSDDDRVSPERFGAVGNGAVDDTAALQAAFDSGRSVHLAAGKVYLVKSSLTLSANNVSLAGGGMLKIAADFRLLSERAGAGTNMRMLFVTGSNVTISDVVFDATEAPLGSAVENGFIWSTAPWTRVVDCQFTGNRKGTCIWALGNAPYLHVTGCQFIDCSGAVFAKGRNTVVAGNIVRNATDAAIAINGVSSLGAVVANNTISNDTLAVIPSMIAMEEGASLWSITGNTLIGVNGGGIVCINVLDSTPVKGGVIANNIITGRGVDGTLPRSSNPAALLAVSGFYSDWIVHDNQIQDCPTGNPNSRHAVLPATGGSFHDNLIDGAATPGLSALVEISAGTRGLMIKDNKTSGSAGVRHYLFGGGDYANNPCLFVGGQFIGGAEGVNCEFKSAIIKNLIVSFLNVQLSTAKVLVNAATLLGDRARFLNAGAWARPHTVGVLTEMYCDITPSQSGHIPFQPGDKFHYLRPDLSGSLGVVRTTTGWMSFGRLGK